ncbi:hypothetical protein CKA32_003645 [Geitlerinema sp. FC II]|nr:hypothetical protein CKA32_003645 [Geitlerinema sp. FC II]
MKIWLDAQLPPKLANWLVETFDLEASALQDLELRDARDVEIFENARSKNAVILTKDSDFIDLVCRLGAPPQILWLTWAMSRIVTYGNCLERLYLTPYSSYIQQGEAIVEISNTP